MQNDGQSNQQDEWVEENWVCHVASDVIRSEPSQCNPDVDWNLRILDVFLHKKRELTKNSFWLTWARIASTNTWSISSWNLVFTLLTSSSVRILIEEIEMLVRLLLKLPPNPWSASSAGSFSMRSSIVIVAWLFISSWDLFVSSILVIPVGK